ncbi:MAG: UDP-2,3-diacylglucosamine diphosphatase LpxI [Pseudomonadota bacterium]
MSSGAIAEAGWSRLGVLAGSGSLPLRVAQAEANAGREPFIVRLTDEDSPILKYPNERVQIGELGRVIKRLKSEGCDAVCLAGQLQRPNFASIIPDWRGARVLPKVVAAARKGDGAIIDVMVGVFEDEGFQVVGAEAAAGQLLLGPGSLGQEAPSQDDFADVAKGARLVEALGPFDVGQGAVVRRGFVLAIEAAEGTDAMLRRCAQLPETLKGFEPGQVKKSIGVLVKCPKPGQELRVDLPTIGVETIERAAAAGLAGIAAEAGHALVIDRDDVVTKADALGVFVYGYRAEELLG